MRKLLALIALAACSGEGQIPIPAQSNDDTCKASEYMHLVGEPASSLERVLILGRVRLIRPNTLVTHDYVPQRINFGIDAKETIVAITCG